MSGTDMIFVMTVQILILVQYHALNVNECASFKICCSESQLSLVHVMYLNGFVVKMKQLDGENTTARIMGLLTCLMTISTNSTF